MFAIFKTVFLLVLAALVGTAALLVPAHVRSIDPSVLEWLGTHERSAADKVWEALDAAHLGPAQLLIEATSQTAPELKKMGARSAELLQENPQYRISGGPSPYFEAFLEATHPEGIPLDTPNAVLSMLLPRSERLELADTLKQSSNSNVAALLSTRDLRGLIQLHPADHAAGGPYDAGVLTMGLLIQGDHFDPALAQQIGSLAKQAAASQPAAVRAYEQFMIATLSLGRRLDFRSLASLAEITEDLDDWARMAGMFRAQPNHIPLLYSTLRFNRDSAMVYDYLAIHPETAHSDLAVALSHGPEATRYLLEAEQPLFEARSLVADLIAPLEPYRPPYFIRTTAESNNLGLLLKLGLFSAAGFCFAFAMGAAWRGSMPKGTTTVSRHNPAVLARDAFISLVVAITLWTMAEPDVLKSQEDDFDSAPRIEFAVADTLQSLKSPVKAMQDLNQVTLLVLALFFIVQLVIYCFCLIKLREVAKQPVSPALKLRLLENEDQLFDFGLYVGLGGTVLSLILVAVGIVEASLMAAYASTLFGIIFVAMLKVLHVRPYRRKLIMQASDTGAGSDSLMQDINL